MIAKPYEEYVRPRLDEIAQWAESGLTEKEIYQNLGLGRTLFYEYKKRHTELAEVLKSGRKAAIAQVENALFKSAVGYEYDEVVEEQDTEGNIYSRKVTRKKNAPNTTAMIFYLTNRASDNWRHKSEQTLTVREVEQVAKGISDLTKKLDDTE